MKYNQYLQKGFIWDGKYWELDIHPPRILKIDYEQAKELFWERLDEEVKPLAEKPSVLWTMSSGMDTSAILTHAKRYNSNLHTICLDNGRGDAEFSEQLAADWNFKNHEVVQVDPDLIEPYLLEINETLTSPVAHSYLFFSYYLFKYAEDNAYENVVMGDGPDVSMLGTHVLHQEIIENAIKLGQYDLNVADEVLQKSVYVEPTALEHTRLLCNALTKFKSDSVYNTRYFYNTWSRGEIPGIVPKWELVENTIEHRIWAEWIQFLFRTRKPTNELLRNFNFIQESPFLKMSGFCLSLPVEYRYCLNSTKHLMVDTYGQHLPLYITYKTRTGFNPSDPWANRYGDVIDYLLDKWVTTAERKIHDYVDVNHMHNGFFTFNQKWSLINLSMWLEKHEILQT